MSHILFLSIELNAFEKSIKSNMAGRLLAFTPSIICRKVSITINKPLMLLTAL